MWVERIGIPFTLAGLNLSCVTSSSACSSTPNPNGWITEGFVTLLSAFTVKLNSNKPSAFALTAALSKTRPFMKWATKASSVPINRASWVSVALKFWLAGSCFFGAVYFWLGFPFGLCMQGLAKQTSSSNCQNQQCFHLSWISNLLSDKEWLHLWVSVSLCEYHYCDRTRLEEFLPNPRIKQVFYWNSGIC